jgi:3',5'-cyclic AMP phosphodiesterase CpdA
MKYIKKTLLSAVSSVLICALLSSCPVLSSVAKAEEALSIHVIADAHFRPLSAVPDVSTVQSMPESALYSHAQYNGQLYAESEAILAKFLENAANSSSSVVLIAGDTVDGAQKASHIEFAQRLADFENSTGKRVFVINGNNDISLNNPSCASNIDYAEIYARFGYDEALSRDPSSLSYTVDLDSNYRLLAIDACIYGESPGVVSPALLQWIREQADGERG